MTRGVRIEAPHFVARVEIDDQKVVFAAPILHYTLGWTLEQLRALIRRKHWKATIIRD